MLYIYIYAFPLHLYFVTIQPPTLHRTMEVMAAATAATTATAATPEVSTTSSKSVSFPHNYMVVVFEPAGNVTSHDVA